MQEVIAQLKDQAGLTDEQAKKAIEIMKGFVMSKVPPMFSAVVEGFFENKGNDANDPLSLM